MVDVAETGAALDFTHRRRRIPAMRAQNILRVTLVALLLSGTGAGLRAEEAAEPAEAEVKTFPVTDLEAMKPYVGRTVAVEGTVTAAGKSGSGTVHYLNFSKPFWKSIALIFFESSTKVPLETLDGYVGQSIRATGKLGEHNTKLQIEIKTPDQIEVLPGAEPAEAETPAAE